MSTPAFLHAFRPFDGRSARSNEERKIRLRGAAEAATYCPIFRFVRPRCNYATQSRHLNWTFSGQLIFGQFPRKIVPGMHIPRRKRKTAKGKSVSCAIAHTGLDYSIVNMGSTIFFPPNTHQQQHFATSFNAFRHTSSDAQNITLFFLRVPSCVGVLMPTSFTRM